MDPISACLMHNTLDSIERNNEQDFRLFFFLNIVRCHPIHPAKLCIEKLSHLNEGSKL